MYKKLQLFLLKQEAQLAKKQFHVKQLRDDKIKYIVSILGSYDVIMQELIQRSDDKYKSYILNTSVVGPILKRTTAKVSMPQKNDRPDFDEDEQIKIFKNFLSQNYTPPSELIELKKHLSSLLMYYVYFSRGVVRFSFIDLQMDNVLIKVIREVSASMAFSFFKVKSNARTAMSTKSKQTKGHRDARIVRDAYIKLLNSHRSILVSLTKNKVAELIIKNQTLDFSPKKVIGSLEKYYQEKGTPPPWK
jgi:hypothetical protein